MSHQHHHNIYNTVHYSKVGHICRSSLQAKKDRTQVIERKLEDTKGENIETIRKYFLEDRLVKMRLELYIWAQFPYLMDTEAVSR